MKVYASLYGLFGAILAAPFLWLCEARSIDILAGCGTLAIYSEVIE